MGDRASRSPIDLVARVRRTIEGNLLLSMEGAAHELHLAPRTLRRHLADRGLTFSDLAGDARRDRARHLLLTTGRSIGDIARRVGYSSVTTFGRAFQAWTGMSPGAFRRSRSK
jgi:AraC-like DNA-binding protein